MHFVLDWNKTHIVRLDIGYTYVFKVVNISSVSFTLLIWFAIRVLEELVQRPEG